MKKDSVKTRAIAGVLTAVTTASVCSAAVLPSSAMSTEKANSLVQGMATTGLKDVIKLATKSSPVASILGDIGMNAFDGLLNSAPSTSDIMKSIKELSGTIDAYHDEEMKMLFKLDEQYSDLKYSLTMQNVNKQLDKAKNDYTIVLGDLDALRTAIQNSKQNGETLEEDGFITADTYNLYTAVLLNDAEVKQDTLKSDIDTLRTYFCGESKELDEKKAYNIIIDNDKTVCERQSFSTNLTLQTAANMNKSRKELDGIIAELSTDYTAYFSYLQASYQCDRYKQKDNATALNGIDISYQNKLAALANDMKKVQKCYEEADNYFYSVIQASVSYGAADYYYPSASKAWCYSERSACNSNLFAATMKLYSDWGGSGAALRQGLANPSTYRHETVWSGGWKSDCYYLNVDQAPAFYSPRGDANQVCLGWFPVNNTLGYMTLDLNGHNLTTSVKTLQTSILSSTSNPTVVYKSGSVSVKNGTVNGSTNAVIARYSDFNIVW